MNEQLDLTLPAPRARRTDPATSHRAAERANTFSPSHGERIVQTLREHGPLTPKQIAHRSGIDYVAVQRRMTELRARRMVRVLLSGEGEPLVLDGCRVWEAA